MCVKKVDHYRQGLSSSVIINQMIKKINEYDKAGIRVSKHCVTLSTYKKRNIIDLGLSSNNLTTYSQKKKFHDICQAALASGKISKFISPLVDSSEPAFHIEINQ